MPAYLSKLASIQALACVVALIAATHFALAQEATGQPDTLSETYGSWTVTCASLPDQGRFCRIAQKLSQGADKPPILSVFLRNDTGEGELGRITFVTPLGLSLPQGVRMVINEAEVVQAPYLNCQTSGCVAQSVLSDPAIAAMKAGSVASVTLALMDGQQAAITLSLQGFTAAWARLQKL
jgi:invasion protein IalB